MSAQGFRAELRPFRLFRLMLLRLGAMLPKKRLPALSIGTIKDITIREGDYSRTRCRMQGVNQYRMYWCESWNPGFICMLPRVAVIKMFSTA